MIALVDKYRTAVVNNEDTQAVWDSEISTIEEKCQRKFCTTFVDWERGESGELDAKRKSKPGEWGYWDQNSDPLYPNKLEMCDDLGY